MFFLDYGSFFRSVDFSWLFKCLISKLRSFNFAHEFIVQLHPAWDGEPQEAVLQSHNYFQVVNIRRLRTKYIASTKDCQLQCMGTIECLHYNNGVLCRGGSSQVKRSGISWNRRRALVIFQYFETSGWEKNKNLREMKIDCSIHWCTGCPTLSTTTWMSQCWCLTGTLLASVVSVESSFSPKDCAGLMDE